MPSAGGLIGHLWLPSTATGGAETPRTKASVLQPLTKKGVPSPCREGVAQKVWVSQTLHISKKNLTSGMALGQPLGDEL